ncbi:SAM-dependent methyltransferase [Mycoplasmatota bacterium]|nr:SAM-dependent methyltransferase [Mycoplasmatota bacterium]
MKISKRLKKCADYVLPNSIVADVGTDHALLPIYLIENNIASKVIASDVCKGPLKMALKNVKQNNLEDKIEIILSDGIEHLNNVVDTLIISGMGGKLIATILTHENINKFKRLILQPNVASNILRIHLQEIGFKIIYEEMIYEKESYYEILVCEKGEMNLSEREIFFGPIIINNKTKNFINHYQNELNKYENIIKNVPFDDENYYKLKSRISLISND